MSMSCKEIGEKLFTKKAIVSQDNIMKFVLNEFSADDIKKMKLAGKTDAEINDLMKQTISVALRRRKDIFSDTLENDIPYVRNLQSTLLSLINRNYNGNRAIAGTEFEFRNVLRQTSRRLELYKNEIFDEFLGICNEIKDGDSVINPHKFFKDETRSNNFKEFIRSGKPTGDSVEMQFQNKFDTLMDKMSGRLRIDKKALKDSVIFQKSDLFYTFKKQQNNIPKVRGYLLGEQRYNFPSSSRESIEFKEWFMKNFKDTFEDEKDLEAAYQEIFQSSKNLMSDFDEKDATSLGPLRKYERLSRKKIINDKFRDTWLNLTSATGEDMLEAAFEKTSDAYALLKTYGNKPLKNVDIIKKSLLQSTAALDDSYTTNALNNTFKDYEGMIRYAMGDRTVLKPNILLDATDITVGLVRAGKAPFMALRQMDDYTLKNFFLKKYSNKKTAESIGDTLKFTKKAMFSEDFDKLSLKDKEVTLGIHNSLASTLFGQSNNLTNSKVKKAGAIGKAGDISYRYTSGMAYHERIFERAGILHVSNIIKDLQNRNYQDIISVDADGIATASITRRAIQEVGITEKEFNIFKKVEFDDDYFSSSKLNDTLRKEGSAIRDLLFLGEDNLDFSSINKAIELRVKSLIPYEYDLDSGIFKKESVDKLIKDSEKFFEERTKTEGFPELDFAKDNLKDIRYVGNEIEFYWKDGTENLITLKDKAEADLRQRFKQQTKEVSDKYKIHEYKNILKGDKQKEKIIKDYNDYISNLDEKTKNKMAREKIEQVTLKFQDLRNNMFTDSSVLRYDYWDRYIADMANKDTKNACINKMFGFYKSALWKNTERLNNYIRSYDANGEVSVKNFFNRRVAADAISYLSMASVYGTGGMILTGEIFKDDDRSFLARATIDQLFIGTGLYSSAPMMLLEGLADTKEGILNMDSRKTIAGIRKAYKQMYPSYISTMADIIKENDLF